MVSLDYPEDFLKRALQSNLAWLVKSFAINNYLGSSAYRTSWGKWSPSYPETTGYLVPSLLNARDYGDKKILEQICLKQLEYFRSLQNQDGSFSISVTDHEPNVFDNAQILLGLIALYNNDKTTEAFPMIQSCYSWLCSEIDPVLGIFKRYNYFESYNPLYYTRISWILVLTEMTLGLEHDKKVGLLFENQLERWEAHFYEKISLQPGKPAFSHTLVYALRGLYEYSEIMDHQSAKSIFTEELKELCQLVLQNKVLPGQFSNSTFDSSYICSTGNLQLALLLIKTGGLFDEVDKNVVLKILLDPVFKSQRKYSFNKGAVPSSVPVYGKYQRFRYTNWTQKFYLDVITALLAE